MPFSSYLHHDPDYASLPFTIDEELLDTRVSALRAGDYSQVAPISQQLLRIVMGSLGRSRSSNDELIGIANLTLVETVTAAATQLYDNDIIPYVLDTIRHRIQDFMQTEKMAISISARRYREKQIKGWRPPRRLDDSEYTIEAKDESPAYDLMQSLSELATSQRQEAVLQLKAKRYTFDEISKILNIGVGTAVREIRDLEERYSRS